MVKIIQAAIRQSGQIITGRRHNLIIADMIRNLGFVRPIDGEQGFVDEEGNFYNREDAAKIVLENGQVQELSAPPLLYSEDLY